ncbi:hypothetical protein GCM10020256_51510 [Streptomyces thermocoprophilus]
MTLEGPSVYGPSRTDSTMRAVAAAAYRPSRLAGRSSRPPATMGRTRAAGETHTGSTRVRLAMSGMVRKSPARATQSEPSPRK